MNSTENETIHFIQIEQIEILNPRERNEKGRIQT